MNPAITSIDDLEKYLNSALQLEHATIPPYLTALYSLHPEHNSDARHILRAVVIEEMLHLTLVANLTNAVGLTPSLTWDGFVPDYPAGLPDGENDFTVSLQHFCPDAVTTFLNIERPRKAPSEDKRLVRHPRTARPLLATIPGDVMTQYYSIGEFYEEIARGVCYLHGKYTDEGKSLFCGDPARQVTPEYFYSGGGEAIPITDLASAGAALDLIAEQGEGFGGGIYDSAGELAHYYRFDQLERGRYYLKDDEPGQPSGPSLEIDWDAVYPTAANAKLADYEGHPQLYAAAREFNESYAGFLAFLTQAFNGAPSLLLEAVWQMFRVRDDMNRVIRNPIPGTGGVHAAPTFEIH